MKNIVMFFLFVMLAQPFFALDAKVGVFVHVPLVQIDQSTGKPYGPTIDYICAILEEAGYTPVIQVLPLPRILNDLNVGRLDLTLEIGKTAERETFLYYPDTYTYLMKPALTFMTASAPDSIKSIADVKDLKIGYLAGAAIPLFFGDSTGVTFELISGDGWVRQNLAKLLSGRIDAALDQNSISYVAEARKSGVGDKVKTVMLPGNGTEAFAVFSKKSANGKALLDAYNRIMASGKHDESKYIDEFLKK